MTELTLIEKVEPPLGAKVSAGALMPRIFICFENKVNKVFVGRECIRRFRYAENAMKKYRRMYTAEVSKAKRLLKAIGEPSLSIKRKMDKAV